MPTIPEGASGSRAGSSSASSAVTAGRRTAPAATTCSADGRSRAITVRAESQHTLSSRRSAGSPNHPTLWAQKASGTPISTTRR